MKFEDIEINCPNKPLKILFDTYGENVLTTLIPPSNKIHESFFNFIYY